MTTIAPESPFRFGGDLSALVLEQKSAQVAPGRAGVIDSSDDGYEHTVIVSVTGVVDAVNDVPVPGCYANTLKKRLPKQIANHDWGRPQGRYLWMKELLPGDPGLPSTTPKGDPWPKEAGALIGRVRLFKGTREGDEAKVRWAEYGNDLQLSIGYQVKKATRDPRRGTRFLHEVDLFENSEVLWGSSPISGPMPSALAVKMLAGMAMETKGDDPTQREGFDPVDVAGLHVAADDEIDWEEVAEAAKLAPGDDELNADHPDQDDDEDDADGTEDDGEVEAEGDPAPPAGDSGGLTAQDLADAADLGVEIKAAPKKDPKAKRQESQNNNEDFNSKHPRGAAGTPSGGKFVKKGDVQPSGDANGDGLPDNWLAMVKAGDPRYAANAKGKGGKGKGKGKGKGRAAQAAKAARAAEMARRDKVEEQFARQRSVEDRWHAAQDRALAATDNPAEKAAIRRSSSERRKAFAAKLREARAGEMDRRRNWEIEQREATAKTEKKHLAGGELDPDAPHAYQPSDDGTACDDCDFGAKTGQHTDADSMLAGFAWAEEQAWLGGDTKTLGVPALPGGHAGAAADAAGRTSRSGDVGVGVAAAESGSGSGGVLGGRDGFQVAGSDAARVSAQVVQGQPFGDRSGQQLVDDPVGQAVLSSGPYDAVAALEPGGPLPAGVRAGRGVNLRQDAGTLSREGGEGAPFGEPAVARLAHASGVDVGASAAGAASAGASTGILGHGGFSSKSSGSGGGDTPAGPPQIIGPDGRPLSTKAEGGADRNRGGAERLRRWYLHEAGIPWNSPGDWAACVAIASKHMRPDQARGYCNLRHRDATGEYAGPKAHGGEGKAYRPDALEGKLLTWEPDAEVGDLAAWRPVETKAANIPAEPMPGTLEERRELVRAAVHELLQGEKDDDGKPAWDSVNLLATFPDKAIARRFKWRDGSDLEETFAVPYTFADGGAVTLGEPEQVVVRAKIEATGTPDAGEPAELGDHPAVGLVEDAAYAVKQLGARTLEQKAGRVLSRVNEQRLREAIMHLLAVCGVAGVEMDLPSKAQVDDANDREGGKAPEPTFTPDTTSVAARETKSDPAVMHLDPSEVAEAMALLLPVEGTL